MTGGLEPPLELRATLAFGQPLRDGVELVRERGFGTIVVLGTNPADEPLASGGDSVDQVLTDEVILRAAQNDGATILNAALDRIVRKHVILSPSPEITAASMGTRHVTAERYAWQTGHPVIAVSEERRTVTLFYGSDRYRLRRKPELRDAITDLMGSLRALRDRMRHSGPAPHDVVARARKTLTQLRGHLVELGRSGDAVMDECATIANTIGVEWRPSAVPVTDPPEVAEVPPPSRAARNEFSGTAEIVVQAARIDAVYLPSEPVRLPTPRQLPPPTPHFTGRVTEVASVVDLLSGSGLKIGVIVGAAGIGKSAFAVRCGYDVGDRFTDGVLYADLRGFDLVASPVDPTVILDRFLRDLGVPEKAIPGDLDGMTNLYRSRLHDRHVLILLDNARDADQVRPLLPGATTCGVLVTSRITMQSLSVREGARLVRLGVLPEQEAITLLGRVTDGDAEPRLLAELARHCGRHPLALCVAAARPADELETFLNDMRVERLEPLSDPSDQAASVRATFSLSYRALPAPAQRTFRLLGLYPGPTISTRAAEVLTGDRDGIRGLVNTHLLEKANRGYYRFHDLLRVYAAECAAESEPAEERVVAVRRVLDWLQRTATAHDRVLDPWRTRIAPSEPDAADPTVADNRAAAGDWLDDELVNLAAATRTALAHGHHELAWRLALAPSAYFFSRKPWKTWVAMQEAGLSAARADGAPAAEAWLCDGLGVAYREQGRHDDARRHFDLAVTRFREIDDAVGEGEATLHQAQMYREEGELERARQASHTARGLFHSAGARHGEAKTANLLGGIYVALGEPDTARAHTEQAVRTFAELGDDYSHSWAVNNLGMVLAKLGHRAQAIAAFRAAMAVRELLDRYGLAFTLQALGDVLHDDGDTAQARHHWQAALAIFDEVGDLRAAPLRARLGTDQDPEPTESPVPRHPGSQVPPSQAPAGSPSRH